MTAPTRSPQTSASPPRDPAADVEAFLSLLHVPGDVFEIRAVEAVDRPSSTFSYTISGYFNDPALAAKAVIELDRQNRAPCIYVTLNPVLPTMLGRAVNRLKNRAKTTTEDKHVLKRRWLLVDCDPEREPKDISSTSAELALSHEKSRAVFKFLKALGWPEPVVLMSGNGYHLLYRIELDGSEESTELVKLCLRALNAELGDEHVKIDESVSNKARVSKVAGTWARGKGDNLVGVLGVEDRPHRRAALVSRPPTIETVPREQLEALAALVPVEESPAPQPSSLPAKSSNLRFDVFPHTAAGVKAYLTSRGVEIARESTKGGSSFLHLKACPVKQDCTATGRSDISVIVGPDGKIAYRNQHDRGVGLEWADVREALEPGYKAWKANGANGTHDKIGSAFQHQQTPSLTKPPPPPEPPEPPKSFRSLLTLTGGKLREYVIDGLLRRRETANIIAPPKVGKSWLMYCLGLSVATSRSFLGTFPTRGGPVFLIDNELHPENIAHRVPRVAEAMGIGIDEYADLLHVESLRGRLKNILSLEPFIRTIERDRFALIIFDAWYRLIPPDVNENDNGAVANLYNMLDLYADLTGSALVLVHHASKGVQAFKSVTDVGAGAGSQSRAADAHIVLREHQQPNAVVLEAAVRSFAPVTPVCLKWQFPLWHLAPELDPTELRETGRKSPVPGASLADQAASFAAAYFGPEPKFRSEIEDAAKRNGMGDTRFKRLLATAQERGLVHRWTLGFGKPMKFATVPQDAPAKGEEGGDDEA